MKPTFYILIIIHLGPNIINMIKNIIAPIYLYGIDKNQSSFVYGRTAVWKNASLIRIKVNITKISHILEAHDIIASIIINHNNRLL